MKISQTDNPLHQQQDAKIGKQMQLWVVCLFYTFPFYPNQVLSKMKQIFEISKFYLLCFMNDKARYFSFVV